MKRGLSILLNIVFIILFLALIALVGMRLGG